MLDIQKAIDNLSQFKEYRAAKVFPKAFMTESGEVAKFHNEVYVMHQLNKFSGGHPHLVKFEHYFDEPKRFTIIQELCTHGHLYGILEK